VITERSILFSFTVDDTTIVVFHLSKLSY